MDVERLRKINALAKELLDHGIVSTMDDAFKQAERMIEKDSVFEEKNEPEIEIKKLDSRSFDTAQRSPQEQVQQSQTLGINYFDLKKINDRISGIESQISQIYLKINELISEINKISDRIEKRSLDIKEEKKVIQQSTLNAVEKKSNGVESHPRVGNYKPEDVAIEKMFYFGGGR